MKKPLLPPFEIRRPFRLWMTGSIAVVMAAVMPMRDIGQAERLRSLRLLRHSQFGVNETMRRLELTARDQGLSILARLPGERPVLVLSSRDGGTPVVMQEADSAPAMPLSLMVSRASNGESDVLVAHSGWIELPDQVADEVAALPRLVERALT